MIALTRPSWPTFSFTSIVPRLAGFSWMRISLLSVAIACLRLSATCSPTGTYGAAVCTAASTWIGALCGWLGCARREGLEFDGSLPVGAALLSVLCADVTVLSSFVALAVGVPLDVGWLDSEGGVAALAVEGGRMAFASMGALPLASSPGLPSGWPGSGCVFPASSRCGGTVAIEAFGCEA